MNPQSTAGGEARAEQDRYARFEADLERRGRARKTIDSYRSDHSGFVEWYAGDRGVPFDLPVLKAADVEAFRDRLVAAGMMTGRGASISSESATSPGAICRGTSTRAGWPRCAR